MSRASAPSCTASRRSSSTRSGYADKLGIPFVIFLGEDEINAGVVAVKDMESGEQVKVSLDEAAKLIHDGLAKKNAGKVICDK